jgi:surfeit locus 1 family protein
MPTGPHDTPRTPRSTPTLVLLGVVILGLIAGLMALGVWQVERLAWKQDLIRQVDARVHAPAVSAPGPDQWPTVSRNSDQYRHVALRGHFDNERETLTQAVTDYGPGFWVLTPFRTDAGFTVLVNRGYVPADRRAPDSRAAGQISGETTVQGLLRITEPKGGFLRANAPAADSWRSRDVSAIAAKRGLTDVAPYFVDADATANAGGWPKGGLTVIRFPNSHLVYALTWFGLALMLAAGGAFLAWDERRVRRAFANGEV